MWAQVVGDVAVAISRETTVPDVGPWLPVLEVPRPADTLTATWDQSLTVSEGQPILTWTARPWTAGELAAMDPERKEQLQAQANAGALQQRLLAALATNQTFLARTSPTTAQVAAQAKALTTQTNALIRLALGALDATT